MPRWHRSGFIWYIKHIHYSFLQAKCGEPNHAHAGFRACLSRKGAKQLEGAGTCSGLTKDESIRVAQQMVLAFFLEEVVSVYTTLSCTLTSFCPRPLAQAVWIGSKKIMVDLMYLLRYVY